MNAATGATRKAVSIAIRLQCADPAEAKRLLRSLAPDDPGTIDLRAEGTDLVMAVESPTALGALRTVDDVLGCLRAASPEL